MPSRCKPAAYILGLTAANLRTKILDIRGSVSSIILLSRGGVLVSIGNFPEISSQRILVGRILVGRLCVTTGLIAFCSLLLAISNSRRAHLHVHRLGDGRSNRKRHCEPAACILGLTAGNIHMRNLLGWLRLAWLKIPEITFK